MTGGSSVHGSLLWYYYSLATNDDRLGHCSYIFRCKMALVIAVVLQLITVASTEPLFFGGKN